MRQHAAIDLRELPVINIEPVEIAVKTQRRRDGFSGGHLLNRIQRGHVAIQATDHVKRLRDALRAQINAILLREGLSAISGIFGLVIIFMVMAMVALRDVNDLTLLVALATTLPKQIDMTHDVHNLAIGWNDLIALWTRASGVVAHMHPELEDKLTERSTYDRLSLRQGDTVVTCSELADAINIALMQPTGRINVRGENGAGKSTLLAALREALKGRAYYWPTGDRLEYAFAAGEIAQSEDEAEDDYEENENDVIGATAPPKTAFSSGERQIRALTEIVRKTRAQVYLLDEWDANLDAPNRARAWALIDELAARARVIEISHRDLKT